MPPYSYQLRHDRKGRIIEKQETVAEKSVTWKYSYDKDGRLFEAHLDGRLICQSLYDKQGRRIRDYLPTTAGPSYRDYQYTMDNRLLRAGNNTYTHDVKGFRSIWSNGGIYHLYEYAPDYRLLRMEVEAQNRVYTFQHDDDGQRAAKYLNGQLAEAYQWLDFIRLGAFHDGRMGYEFGYTDKERLPSSIRREDGAVFTLHYDQVGSLRVVADPHGDVIKEVLYDPFGGIIEDTNPGFRVPIGFAGGLHDRDLGFVRFGWRDYDPFTGRWTAPDPIGDKGGDPDWYGYCWDDPVNGNDPLGLMGAIGEGISPNFSEVWQWQANDNACKKCKSLDGTLYESRGEAPEKPHPNCQCKVVRCHFRTQYGEWKTESLHIVRYEITGAICFGATCRVAWHRVSVVKEKRDKEIIRECGSRITTIKTTSEKRSREKVDVRQADGFSVYQGGDPTTGDVIVSTNPWNPYDTRHVRRTPGP